jgi:hypothetical protein
MRVAKNENVNFCKCGELLKPGRKYCYGHNRLGSGTNNHKNGIGRKYDYSMLGKVIGCCWCGSPLIFKYHHFWLGIPKYCVGHNPETEEIRNKKSLKQKGKQTRFWTDEERKSWHGSGNPRYGKPPANLEQLISIAKRNMSNPEWKAEWLKKVLKGTAKANQRSPNYSEEFLDKRIQFNRPGEFKYTGDGEVIIEGKCPDWTNVNGKKKLIEFAGRRWHKPEYEEIRKEYFKKYGYSCLVIWAEELKDLDSLDKKLQGF